MGLFFGFVALTNLATVENIIALISEDDEHKVGTDTLSLPPTSNTINNTTTSTAPASIPSTSTGLYKDGEYAGTSEYAYYGYVKVKAVIKGGKITDVAFLDHPTHNRTSDYINSQAMPLLTAAAISAQSADVGRVSGASDTSMAFRQSLENALAQAK